MKTESLREFSVFGKAQRKETLILSKDDCIGVSLAAFKKIKKVLAKDPPLCYNTESAGMARLF